MLRLGILSNTEPLQKIFQLAIGLQENITFRQKGSNFLCGGRLIMFVTDGQLHETRRVFIGLGNGNGEKNSIDFRGNSIEKVIIKRSALGRLEFYKKPNSKIRLEQKMV